MSKFSYDFQENKIRNYMTSSISEGNFHGWSKNNFYRTSYNSQSQEVNLINLETIWAERLCYTRLWRLYPKYGIGEQIRTNFR